MLKNGVLGRAAVGAWIEIYLVCLEGSKITVAPPVGAWIEIYGNSGRTGFEMVAPPVGAWIEIKFQLSGFHLLPCRSPRGSVD